MRMWLVGKLKRCTLEWIWFNPNALLAERHLSGMTYPCYLETLGLIHLPWGGGGQSVHLGECIQYSPGFKTTQDLCFVALLLSIQLVNV